MRADSSYMLAPAQYMARTPDISSLRNSPQILQHGKVLVSDVVQRGTREGAHFDRTIITDFLLIPT